MQTFVEVLKTRATRTPDVRAFTFLSAGEAVESCTYGELHQRAQGIARGLAGREGGVLLLDPPGRGFIEALFGCFYAGVTAIPVYPPNPANQKRTLPRLHHMVEDAEPVGVVSTAATRGALAVLEEKLGLKGLDWVASDEVARVQSGEEGPGAEVSPGDVAMLQYTSGSTRTPRGVMLTHGNLVANSRGIQERFAHGPESCMVTWLPPYHDMGLIGGLLQPLYCGFPIVMMSPFEFLHRPGRWLRAISDFHGTTSGGPNFAYDLCVTKIKEEECRGLDLSSWDVAFNGAEPINPATLARFAARFSRYGFKQRSFFACYGLAEASLAVLLGSKADEPKVARLDGPALSQGEARAATAGSQALELVSCGRIIQEHSCLLVDPDTSAPVPEGRVGEIWVRGPSVAMGYWRRPEESERVFTGHLASGEGPYLRTGDLGVCWEGDVYITGRIKDLLIFRGRNYYPHDIEACVADSHPCLRRNACAAFSVSSADEERLAVIQEVDLERGADLDQAILEVRRAISQSCQLQVSAVVLVPPRTVPKTSSGKVQRQLARRLFLEDRLEAVASWRIVTPSAPPPSG